MTDLMGWAALTSTMLNCCEFGRRFGARLGNHIGNKNPHPSKIGSSLGDHGLERPDTDHALAHPESATPPERNIIAWRRWSVTEIPEIPPAKVCLQDDAKVQQNSGAAKNLRPGKLRKAWGQSLKLIPGFRHTPK